jgi:hypothetical protein
MCVTEFTKQCKKYKFYHFQTPEDYDKWIDYDWNKIDKEKYSKYGLQKNPSWLPTYWYWYWLI